MTPIATDKAAGLAAPDHIKRLPNTPTAEANVASAATCDIGSALADVVTITGTTAITSFGTVASRRRYITFAGILTLTHNATTLALPGGANITTAANDTAIATSDAAGNWRVRHYTRASTAP